MSNNYLRIPLFFTVFFLLGSLNIQAANRNWDGGGGADTRWSTAANWSSNQVPVAGDVVTFSGNGGGGVDNNCTIDVTPPALASFSIGSNYSGTVSFNAITLTVNGDFAANGSGTNSGIDAGTSTIRITNASSIDCAATLNNVIFDTDDASDIIALSQNLRMSNDFTITTVGTINGSTLQVDGNITINQAIVNGTVVFYFNGGGTSSFTGNGGGTYGALSIDKDASSDQININSSDTFTSITVNTGIFNTTGFTVSALLTINANGTLAGTGTITGNVSGSGTISPGNSVGVITITGTFTPTGILDIEVDAADGSSLDQISVSSTVNLSGATVHFIFNAFDMMSNNYQIITGAGATGSTGPATITGADWNGAPTYSNGAITATVLPIDLLYFRAALQKDDVVLQWGVASELDNDYMAVERSFDAKDFEEIGRIKGRGTSREAAEYELIDKNPRPGVNYYRLRQVDFDGTITLYDVVSVIVEAGAALQVQVYPNPTADFLQLRWPEPVEKETLLRVLDLEGRQMQTHTLPLGTLTYEFALKNLAPAIYLLQWERQGRIETTRFVKE